MGSQMPHQRAGVEVSDYRNIEAFEIFVGSLLRAPVRADGRELAHHESFNKRANRLIILGIRSVISDLWVCEYYDLPGVGRIGEDFLVSGERGIKNDFAVALCFRSVAFASEDAAIFQRKDCLHLFLRG